MLLSPTRLVDPPITEMSRFHQLGIALDINPSVSGSVTHSSGVVSAVADRSGNGYDFAIAGTGSDVLYDSTDGSLEFQAGKYLTNGNAALQAIMGIGTAKTVIAVYGSDTSPSAMTALFSAMQGASDRFAIGHRSDVLRTGYYNGTAYVGVKSWAQTVPVRKSISVLTWDGSSTAGGVLNKRTTSGTSSPYTAGIAAVTIGAREGGTLPFDGKVYRILVFNRILNTAEINSVSDIISNFELIVGVGQSNEALKHSIAAPYNRDGQLSYIDTRNAFSKKKHTVYLGGAVSGSYVSKIAADAGGGVNYWVDDTGGTPVAGNNLTALQTLIETTNGYSVNQPMKFVLANLESEAAQLNAATVTKAQVKAALQWLIDYLSTRYPNATFHYQIIGRYNSSYDVAVQTCRDIQFEIIAENDNVYYSHDMTSLALQGGDSVHYSPTSYVTATQRQARAINQGIKGAVVGTPTISGAVVTIPYSHGVGATAFTNGTFMPYNNLMTASRDFTTWTVSGCTVTANTTTGVDGIVTTADTIDKTSTGTRSIRKTFSTTTGNHLLSIAAKAGTNNYITALLSGDNATTFHGRVEFDLINSTATDKPTGGSTLVSKGITALGNGWQLCWLVTNLTTATTPIVYVYPDVQSGIGTIGNVILDQCMVSKVDSLVDYADIGKSFFRIFDDGSEATINSITDTGSAFEITLSATPAASSVIDIYGGYGKLDTMQRHTIPVDNSAYAMPMQMFHKTITA